MNVSKINPMLTLEYMIHEHENKYFDRKSAQIKASDLAKHISGFANADGGTIVIGISDKTRKLEGINSCGEEKINEFLNAPKDCCKPMPIYTEEYIQITNDEGKPDRLLLLHIQASVDQIIRTTKDSTCLRIGDRTREMLGDNLRNLEYTKSVRHFEDETNEDASLEDLDPELLDVYRGLVGGSEYSFEEILKARGFVKKGKLTNAAVLLFARNIQQFYPNCRIRFVRYDGTYAKVGTEINVIKDKSIDLPILKIIDDTKKFVLSQLRDFTTLNQDNGKFVTEAEYPEFAWLEGIVNAVAHREYGMTGSYIKISMYDDRLEIESPGKLPNIVTVDNIKETRYSRNPRISRVLTEFGWVKELNEGVKRIFSDMEKNYLDAPEYSEPEQSVRLILKNNIIMRTLQIVVDRIGIEAWEKMDNVDKQILSILIEKGAMKRSKLAEIIDKSDRTITLRLNKLISMGIIQSNGNRYDPNRTYEMIH